MSKALNVAVCQVNPTLGNFQKNIDIISKNYKYAVEKGADLVVFPEMSITGYPPQDLLNNKEFISQNISCLNELTKSTTIPCIFGYVDFEDNKKFNAAAVCQDGEIVYKYHKIHLPNYDVFDERRYFHSGDSIGIFDLKVNNSEIGKVLIKNSKPFALIKIKEKEFEFDKELNCEDAKVLFKKPQWLSII